MFPQDFVKFSCLHISFIILNEFLASGNNSFISLITSFISDAVAAV